ncbi:MAG: DUF3810 family protein [Planctomycetes bacterium]|nr:DUF3810 family protein [Planctomycetota bacterium]
MSSPPAPRPRQRLPRRIATVCLAAACVLWTFVPPSPGWVEARYSRRAYPAIAAFLVRAGDLAPFSLSVMVLAFVLLVGPPAAARSWRRRRAEGASIAGASLGPVEGAATLAVAAYASFILLWGAGYRRERLEGRLGLEERTVEAGDIARWTAGLAGRVAADLPEDAGRDGARALASLRGSLSRLVATWDGAAPALPRRVKRLPAGWLLCFGTSGVTVPFTLEVHVDGGEPEIAFLAVAAHELAHVAGLCGEADADLAAALAGLEADDPYARYATALGLFRRFAAWLPAAERGAARSALPPRAQEDLEAMEDAARRYTVEGLAAAQHAVYHAYLKSQGVKEGMREYSQLVKLLVRAEAEGLARPGREAGREKESG